MAKTLLFVLLALLLACVVSAHRTHGGPGKHGDWRKAIMDRYQRDCADDQQRACPEDAAPQDPKQIAALFASECFKANADTLSNPCQQMITDWRTWVAQHDKPSTNEDSEGQKENDDDKENKEDDDKNKENDDDDEEEDKDSESGAQGSKFYTACHADRVNICPDLPDNVSPHDFLTAKCFARDSISGDCKKYLEKWMAMRGARMAAFGILISTTLCSVFGLLACLTLSCCVACCIRRRRVVLMRRMAQKKAAAKAKAIESEQPCVATPVFTQATDAEPVVMVADMENAFPMQTFPAGSAYSPYSYPATWQPVFFAPPQYTAVPTAEPTEQQQ